MKKLKKGERKEVPNWQKYLPLKKIVDTNTPSDWGVEKVTLVEDKHHPSTHVEVVFIKGNKSNVRATFSGAHVRKLLHRFSE